MIHRGVLHSTGVVRAVVVAAESVLAAGIPRSLTAAAKRRLKLWRWGRCGDWP